LADVRVKNGVKRYGTVQVMHGVSVDIEDGESIRTGGSRRTWASP
jgi:multiple sugar transport system ATP-binding protein